MNRKIFVQSLAILPLAAASMKLKDLSAITAVFNDTPPLPVMFLGHGSPMNAIEENTFTKGWKNAGKDLPKPNAILCISAHWETRGTFVTAMEHPRTIHDFGGFPQQLFDVQYPAPGSPDLANQTKELVTKTNVGLDEQWGLDHGAWSVIKHLYPDADVPVIQMSLDYSQPPLYHYELAKELAALRKKGILIIGSGNMVHNLRMVAWDKMNEPDYAFDWAIEASTTMKDLIVKGDHQALTTLRSKGKPFELAIPTPEHYLPLLYVMALKDEKENIELFNDNYVAGSLTMTSVKIG